MKEPKLKEKRWSKDIEKEIYLKWKEEEPYKFDLQSERPVFSIDTPPPYVNMPVHIGHVTTYILMDMMARSRRMLGYNVLFPLGLDRNGLPIEMEAEKRFKVSLTKVSRKEALKLCRKILEEASLASVESFLRCGISFNSWKIGPGIGEIYFTDSDEYRALTQATFIELWKKGLIYEAERVNNFCPGCGTTIADAEVVYEEKPTLFNYIKFKVKETGEDIVIGTTRPELLCSCAIILFNPSDDRYKHLEGKTAIVPLYEKEVPIRAHPIADPEKGTGLVMMCSFGDLTDVRFFREMGLKPIIAIDSDGRMNENSGFLFGLSVEEARKKIIEELKNKGLLVKQEKVMHRTPICERSGHPIEFIALKEFYLKQVEFKEDMLELANQLNFFAPQSRQILVDWINSVSIDWPISRRRVYATEIPLWYCKSCGEAILPEPGKYYQPWNEPAPVKKCPKCGGKEFVGEERVFDTWFDSSITPLYVLGWHRSGGIFDRVKRCSLRPQGKEIIRTWLYYTLLKCYLLTGERIFDDVWVNFHIVDEKGYKMSKSKGNVIKPEELLDRFGAEPVRLWAAVEGDITKTDFKCSFERIGGAAKTITKLWNVARFISIFDKYDKPEKLCMLDKWILQELNKLIKLARKSYGKYDFHVPAIKLRHFLWETFASHYIELVKRRAYNSEGEFSQDEQRSAIWTLYECLRLMLLLFAPILPMISYRIYSVLFGKDVHKESFPSELPEEEIPFSTDQLIELNKKIWKKKKDAGMSLKDPLDKFEIPKEFREIEKDLTSCHNLREVVWV